jgi:hypothetical protein
MSRGFPFLRHRFSIGFILVVITGLLGCGNNNSATTADVVVQPISICTPESPLINIYRTIPQSWSSAIFEYAFPVSVTPIPPNTPVPIQFNEQQILSARYAAFQQLVKETKRWTDVEVIKTENTRETRLTLTFIGPELLQAVVLNETLKDHFLTSGFQSQLQTVLESVAERNELLFLLTITTLNNNTYSAKHTIQLPIDDMSLRNAENLTIIRSHDDQNLEQLIDISAGPVFGYISYPLSIISASQCSWVLDPKFNKKIVIVISNFNVDGVNTNSPLSWSIPYAPLLYMNLPSNLPDFNMPPGFDANLMTPLSMPPDDVNQVTYWQDFARFIWGQVTLENY